MEEAALIFLQTSIEKRPGVPQGRTRVVLCHRTKENKGLKKGTVQFGEWGCWISERGSWWGNLTSRVEVGV
jgi:hypothetical protein